MSAPLSPENAYNRCDVVIHRPRSEIELTRYFLGGRPLRDQL